MSDCKQNDMMPNYGIGCFEAPLYGIDTPPKDPTEYPKRKAAYDDDFSLLDSSANKAYLSLKFIPPDSYIDRVVQIDTMSFVPSSPKPIGKLCELVEDHKMGITVYKCSYCEKTLGESAKDYKYCHWCGSEIV